MVDYNDAWPHQQPPELALSWTATGTLDDGAPGDATTGITATYERYYPPAGSGFTPSGNRRVLGRAVLDGGDPATLASLRWTCRDYEPEVEHTLGTLNQILENQVRVSVWCAPDGPTPWYSGSPAGVGEYLLLASSPIANHYPSVLPDFSEDIDDVPGLRIVGVRDGNDDLQCRLQTTGGNDDLSGLGIVLTEVVISIEVYDINVASFSGNETTFTWRHRITDIRANEGGPVEDCPVPPPPSPFLALPSIGPGGIGRITLFGNQ